MVHNVSRSSRILMWGITNLKSIPIFLVFIHLKYMQVYKLEYFYNLFNIYHSYIHFQFAINIISITYVILTLSMYI